MTEFCGASALGNVPINHLVLFVGGGVADWKKELQVLVGGIEEERALFCPENAGQERFWDDSKKFKAVIADYERLTPFQLELLPKLKLQMPFTPILVCVEASNAVRALQSLGTSIDDCIIKVEGYTDLLGEKVRWMCARMEREERKHGCMVETFRNAQRMEAVGVLAGGIAHEFNNVLSIVFGHVQLALLRLMDDHPVRDHLKQALSAGGRAKDLVKDILNISRVQNGEPQKAQLGIVVKEVIKFLKASVPSSIEIRQKIQLQPQGWDTVLCHMTHVYQIFLSICTNALKSIGLDQYGTVTVELYPYEVIEGDISFGDKLKPGKYAALRVLDSGMGTPGEAKGMMISDPCLIPMGKDFSSGVGLGFARELLESYGGGMSIENLAGECMAVTVLLRCEEAPKAFESSDDGRSLPMGQGRILLVDDEEMIVQVGRLMLNKLGYAVQGVTDSGDALDLFRGDPEAFDLVILDLTMPKMTGFDLAKSMLAVRSDIPIVVCSGRSDDAATARLKEMGITAFLRKPFIIKLLAETVKGAMGRNRPSS